MLILANAPTQVRVRRVRKYNTFKAMIQAVGVRKLLPDWDEHTYPKNKLEWAVSTYMNFANGRGTYADLEDEFGAVAIDVEPLIADDSSTTKDDDDDTWSSDCCSDDDDDSSVSSGVSTVY